MNLTQSIDRAALCLLLAAGCAPALAQDQRVSAREIQDTWVGKTLVGTAANGAAVTMKLQADGTAGLVAGTTTDSGTWRVQENGYCTTWKTIRAGQERCFTAHRAGARITVLNPDGTVSGHFSEIRQ